MPRGPIMVGVRPGTSREHVAEPARLRDPVGAVEELLWNALDGVCVVVTLERNDLGGVDRVRIQDDGYGMSAEDCEEYFRHLPGEVPGRLYRVRRPCPRPRGGTAARRRLPPRRALQQERWAREAQSRRVAQAGPPGPLSV
ncbi:ATP-binding protein [Streptomyces sp. NPDC020731]|uniref:ATP-binding protein n=1 Tax=Streptomyces sp. NPDC020731 TaxID=3365085 RepID=UPI0037ADC85A